MIPRRGLALDVLLLLCVIALVWSLCTGLVLGCADEMAARGLRAAVIHHPKSEGADGREHQGTGDPRG